MDTLRVFCQKTGLAATSGEQFTTVLNGKDYVYVKDLAGDTDSIVKLFRRINPEERRIAGAAVSTSKFSLIIATWNSALETTKYD